MTIKELHDSIRELANIGQSQYFPPETIDGFINDAVQDFFRQEYKHFEATQEISDTLGYYKTVSSQIDLDVLSVGDLPSDYYHMTGCEAVLSDGTIETCEMLTDAEFIERKRSGAFAPSLRFPVGRLIGTKKIEALPLQVIDTDPDPDVVTTEGVDKLIIYYLRKPATAKFAYTISANGTSYVYDEGNSVQVDWPEIGHTQIRDKAVGYAGVALRDRTLMGHETVKKNQNEDA